MNDSIKKSLFVDVTNNRDKKRFVELIEEYGLPTNIFEICVDKKPWFIKYLDENGYGSELSTLTNVSTRVYSIPGDDEKYTDVYQVPFYLKNNLCEVKRSVFIKYIPDQYLNWCLRHAVHNKHTSDVVYLIKEKGADPNTNHGFCIETSIFNSDYDTFNVLVENGARYLEKDLQIAVSVCKNNDIIQFLYDEFKNSIGDFNLLLENLIMNKCDFLFLKALEKSNINNKQYRRLVKSAMVQGNEYAFKTLIDNKDDIKYNEYLIPTSMHYGDCFHIVYQESKDDISSSLLDTCLQCCTKNDNVKVFKYIYDNDILNVEKDEILKEAVEHNSVKIVTFMLNMNVNVSFGENHLIDWVYDMRFKNSDIGFDSYRNFLISMVENINFVPNKKIIDSWKIVSDILVKRYGKSSDELKEIITRYENTGPIDDVLNDTEMGQGMSYFK